MCHSYKVLEGISRDLCGFGLAGFFIHNISHSYSYSSSSLYLVVLLCWVIIMVLMNYFSMLHVTFAMTIYTCCNRAPTDRVQSGFISIV